jgi:hypothetical protein
MPHVSRPLIGVLVATVLLLVLWVVALKPSGNGSGSGSRQGLGRYQSAINAAHQAVQTGSADSGRAATADPTGTASTAAQPAASPAGAPTTKAPTGSATAGSATGVASTHFSKPAIRLLTGARTAAARSAAVQRALATHRVLALLFYNPAGADDRALRQELGAVPTHGGKVFTLAIPLNEMQGYLAITSRVPVNVSPTLVLIAPGGQADEIVGYADPFEISQRVDDALVLRP